MTRHEAYEAKLTEMKAKVLAALDAGCVTKEMLEKISGVEIDERGVEYLVEIMDLASLEDVLSAANLLADDEPYGAQSERDYQARRALAKIKGMI